MIKPPFEQRLDNLEHHLRNENPVLVDAVRLFRELDVIVRNMGLLGPNESYASRISWWPLISILGTFSAGKSSFVNSYLEAPLQRTGNQAIDEKFTVVVYSGDENNGGQVLPGVALDADPRFPFFRMSEQLERVLPGEGSRIDSYLQLKTACSSRLRGKILIDSPGFDADAQRDSVLRIVDHIVDLSDLVLVMFDARHPEPGAMRDTLQHLVRATSGRADAGKFVYALNQIDTAAREDNVEDIVAAWQRCLASAGLTAGRFFTIYNPEVAVEIPEAQRARFEAKRDSDLEEIYRRIDQVEVGRAYRVVAALETLASSIEDTTVPRLREALEEWRGRVLRRDAIQFGLLFLLGIAAVGGVRGWGRLFAEPSWWESFVGSGLYLACAILVVLAPLVFLHYRNRRVVAQHIARNMQLAAASDESGVGVGDVASAMTRSTRWARSLFARNPSGWTPRSQRRAASIRGATTQFVQTLNDHFAGSDK